MTKQNNGDLATNLLSLKGHPGWKYLSSIIETWKNQAMSDIIEGTDSEKEKTYKGEFKAYGRVLALPERLIKDLTDEPPSLDGLDPYK